MEGENHNINNNVLFILITEESAIVESPIVIIIIPPAIIISSSKVISTYRSTVLVHVDRSKESHGRCRDGGNKERKRVDRRSESSITRERKKERER